MKDKKRRSIVTSKKENIIDALFLPISKNLEI
jgi:hypothetical protein